MKKCLLLVLLICSAAFADDPSLADPTVQFFMMLKDRHQEAKFGEVLKTNQHSAKFGQFLKYSQHEAAFGKELKAGRSLLQVATNLDLMLAIGELGTRPRAYIGSALGSAQAKLPALFSGNLEEAAEIMRIISLINAIEANPLPLPTTSK